MIRNSATTSCCNPLPMCHLGGAAIILRHMILAGAVIFLEIIRLHQITPATLLYQRFRLLRGRRWPVQPPDLLPPSAFSERHDEGLPGAVHAGPYAQTAENPIEVHLISRIWGNYVALGRFEQQFHPYSGQSGSALQSLLVGVLCMFLRLQATLLPCSPRSRAAFLDKFRVQARSTPKLL